METEMIKIVQIKDFSQEFINEWGGIKPFMKKGWVTYAYNWNIELFDGSAKYKSPTFIVDNNKYNINFLTKDFELWYATPYQRKLEENKRKREDVIKQSEIKHKVTLISI